MFLFKCLKGVKVIIINKGLNSFICEVEIDCDLGVVDNVICMSNLVVCVEDLYGLKYDV